MLAPRANEFLLSCQSACNISRSIITQWHIVNYFPIPYPFLLQFISSIGCTLPDYSTTIAVANSLSYMLSDKWRRNFCRDTSVAPCSNNAATAYVVTARFVNSRADKKHFPLRWSDAALSVVVLWLQLVATARKPDDAALKSDARRRRRRQWWSLWEPLGKQKTLIITRRTDPKLVKHRIRDASRLSQNPLRRARTASNDGNR